MTIGEWFRQLDFTALIDLVIVVCAALVCIIFHECAHGLVALWLGDDTAKRAKRLTLNPLRHVDPIGLLMMAVAKIGWAKPVPINPRRFKNPRLGMALTAAAGPACNLLMAVVSMAAMALLLPLGVRLEGFWYEVLKYTVELLQTVAVICCGLVVFNLLPIPPLDGSKLLAMVLPDGAYRQWMRYEQYGMFLLIGLFILLPYVTDFSPIGCLQMGLYDRLVDWIVQPILRLMGY